VTPLRGRQLAIVLDVPTYELENPPRKGDRFTTTSGIATVTYIEQVGREKVFWADYGSGISQPRISEGILSVSPPEQSPSPRTRRHTPKGKACGWIEERVGNKQRQKPSVSYYYCWDGKEGRSRRYISAGKVNEVKRMLEARCGIEAVIKLLNEPVIFLRDDHQS